MLPPRRAVAPSSARSLRWSRSLAAALLASAAGVFVSSGGCGTDEHAVQGPAPYVPVPDFRVPNERDLRSQVDPLIGTSGSGNVIPGALVPHGMVRVSPTTTSSTSPASGRVNAYAYDDDLITGFSHLNLEGPGGSYNGYGQILFMPATGMPDFARYALPYSHDDEVASPGLYAVTLGDKKIRAELTASLDAAVHRYTFPAGQASILIDLGATLGRDLGATVTIEGDNVVHGVVETMVQPAVNAAVSPGQSTTGVTWTYFYATFSQPFASFATWQKADPPHVFEGQTTAQGMGIGAWLRFDPAPGQVVEARVGISMIDEAQAERNADEQVVGKSFEQVRDSAADAWNARLNRIQVDAAPEVQRMFYTALYHATMQPANYTEAGGRFAVSSSGERHVLDGGGRPYYLDDWCMWDTFRTTHPLGTFYEPEIRSDIIRSMLIVDQEGGWLEKCSWNATGYSRVMIGNPAIPITVDAWMKGLRDFDPDLAWQAMNKISTQDIDTNIDGLCGFFGTGVPAEYLSKGYVGFECDPTQAASMTLEFAYDDFCMAEFAASRGMSAEESQYRQRAQNFRNHWNPDIGFMQPKRRDGSWLEPYDPADKSGYSGWCESSGWIYTFFVPHDIPALIELMGGNDAFVAKLDQFFDQGYFDPSNEPSFHIPFLYNYAGAPWKTQARVRHVLSTSFSTGPNGLPGNDDSGATSAWYVLAALGLYPVTPGKPQYQLSAPIVDRAVIYLHPSIYPGGSFVIETENNQPGNDYIQSVTLNGAPLNRTWITHDELTAGGTLHFVLGPQPSTWGTAQP